MTTTTLTGHAPRKTLASQLDRLDGIIDTLADGLTGAVADAVRDAVTAAVRQAVEQVLHEVLANPELLRALIGPLAPPPSVPTPQSVQADPAPSKLTKACVQVKGALGLGWRRLRDRAKSASRWIGTKVRALPGRVRDGLKHLRIVDRLRSLRQAAAKAWELRRPVTLSLAAGVVAGLAGYLAGPVVSAFALGACGSTMTLAAVLVAPFVRMWKALAMPSA